MEANSSVPNLMRYLNGIAEATDALQPPHQDRPSGKRVRRNRVGF
jgi:hypothetical protein